MNIITICITNLYFAYLGQVSGVCVESVPAQAGDVLETRTVADIFFSALQAAAFSDYSTTLFICSHVAKVCYA